MGETVAKNKPEAAENKGTAPAAAEEGVLPAAAEPPASEGPTVEELQQRLEEESSRAREYLDGWQRARAEFANYKKRVEREQNQAYQNAAGSVIKRYLEIMDDLERALKNRPVDGDGAAWAAGIELIYRKLQALLESEGVKPMGRAGDEFDPNLHEAISLEENQQYQSGQIIEVLEQGYMLGERVLRPARVRVAR